MKHVMIHSGEKFYKCILCPRDFTSSEDLKKHIKVHNRESLKVPRRAHREVKS